MPSTHSISSVEEASTPIEAINTRGSKSQQITGTNDLDLVQSHLSHHDMPVANDFQEVDAEQYLRFSPTRKIVIVFVLSFCSFLAPISSTSILSGIPEVATTYNTTGSIINASNALYLAFMGVSAPFWGPFSQVWGRRPVSCPWQSYVILFGLMVPVRFSLQAPSFSSHSALALRWPRIFLHTSSSAFSLPFKARPSW